MAYKLPQNEFLNTFVQPTRDDAIPAEITAAVRSVASLMLASLPGFDVEMPEIPGFNAPQIASPMPVIAEYAPTARYTEAPQTVAEHAIALSELDPVTMRLRRRYGARRGD